MPPDVLGNVQTKPSPCVPSTLIPNIAVKDVLISVHVSAEQLGKIGLRQLKAWNDNTWATFQRLPDELHLGLAC